jgi:hypothetical protein
MLKWIANLNATLHKIYFFLHRVFIHQHTVQHQIRIWRWPSAVDLHAFTLKIRIIWLKFPKIINTQKTMIFFRYNINYDFLNIKYSSHVIFRTIAVHKKCTTDPAPGIKALFVILSLLHIFSFFINKCGLHTDVDYDYYTYDTVYTVR